MVPPNKRMAPGPRKEKEMTLDEKAEKAIKELRWMWRAAGADGVDLDPNKGFKTYDDLSNNTSTKTKANKVR